MSTTITSTNTTTSDGETKAPAPQSLLTTLSAAPPSTCTSRRIDFASEGLPEYSKCFALLINNLFTPAECRALVSAAETARASTSSDGNTWGQALVNTGGGKQRLITEARYCDRIIWDVPAVADVLLARLLPHLPAEITTLTDNSTVTGYGPVRRKETWELAGLNERLRFLRYSPGMFFTEHCDATYKVPGREEMAWVTVHVYLNGGSAEAEEDKKVEGGATRFSTLKSNARDKYVDVNPTVGSCVVFQHRDLLHSGEEVISGTKYTLRTDILYRLVGNKETGES